MKKLFILGTAALMFTGVAFAHDGNKGKKQKKFLNGQKITNRLEIWFLSRIPV